ncbi:MAG: leucine-rich repeat protein, partial [Muribaculaceae bacterium]|nr:leucine-rich repeat protein [Muribaculaceae bacterium]
TTLNIPGYVTYNGNSYRVKQINQSAFENNTKITSVTFGYGVEYISSYVFDGCTNLKYVNLPSSVNEIGQFVFQNCTSLYVVAFAGEKAPKIYDYTFNLSSTTKKASTATYRGMNALKADAKWVAAFGASNILRHYSYKVGDFKVYNSTHGCWQYYIIKNGIPYNGYSSNLSKLSSCVLVAATFTDDTDYTVTLPQRISNSDNNSPGSYHFYGVADSAFMNNTAITDIYDNNTMANKIGIRAFYGCTNLTYANVPVDTIDNYAFFGCTKLVSVDLYNFNLGTGPVRIGGYAFGICGLKTVALPKSVMTLGYAPFYNNTSLTSIAVDGENTKFCSWKGALYDYSKKWLYQIPGKWTHNGYYGSFAETLERVLAYAGAGSNLYELYLPYNVKTIDQYAFQNCTGLSTVHMPSSVTSVSNTAFQGCSAIRHVHLNLLTPPTIDYFPSVTDKSNVEFFTPYEAYSAYASSSIWSQYNRCTGTSDHTNCWDIQAEGVRFTVLTTSPYYFNSFSSDGTVKIVWLPAGNIVLPLTISYGGKTYMPTEVGYRAAFYPSNTTGFSQGSYKSSILKIHDYAFANTQLASFEFESVEEIGEGAFQNTTYMVDELKYDNMRNIRTIGNRAFYNSGITKFEPQTSLTTIGNYAFYNCSNLHEIFLPHIDGKNPITCGQNFFGGNLASDFKCWVDYRRLGDFVNTSNWDVSKIYPHLRFDYANDSQWQSFACVKPIDFEGTGLEAYRIDVYNPADQMFIIKPIIHLYEKEGALVHGNGHNYYRLNYATNNLSSCSWLQAVTDDPHTVVSDNTTSYYYFGGTDIPRFDLIRTNKTISRGHAYVKMNYSLSGGIGTIYTDLSSSGAVPGDVNGDGIVSSVDITAIYNYLLNNDSSAIVNGDQDNDGSITAGDIVIIYNILLGQ